MQKIIFTILIAGSVFSPSSWADSIFTNKLRQFIDSTTKQNTNAGATPSTTQTPEEATATRQSKSVPLDRSRRDSSPTIDKEAEDAYCSKVSENSFIRKYIEFAIHHKQPGELKEFLDTDGILIKWVAQRAKESGARSVSDLHENTRATYYGVDQWPLGDSIRIMFVKCAVKSIDSDDFAFYASSATYYSLADIREKAKSAIAKAYKTENIATLDAQGNIVTSPEKPPERKLLELYTAIAEILEIKPYKLNERSATYYALGLPNGENALNTAAKKSPEIMTALLIKQKDIEDYNVAFRNEKEQERIAREKNQSKFGAELIKYQSYLNTSEGRIFNGYKHIQLLETCYKSRVGMAAIYLSHNEYESMEAKIIKIEQALIPKISVNKDKLWSNAALANRNGAPFKGIDMVQWIQQAEFEDAAKTCTALKNEFLQIATDILGKDEIRKSF